MSTAETKQKTLFLNGVEVDAIEPSGNVARDLAAAREFLAEKGFHKPQQRLTLRAKLAHAWRRRFF